MLKGDKFIQQFTNYQIQICGQSQVYIRYQYSMIFRCLITYVTLDLHLLESCITLYCL